MKVGENFFGMKVCNDDGDDKLEPKGRVEGSHHPKL